MIVMGRISKSLVILFIPFSFFLCVFSPAWSGRGDIDFKLEGHTLSANLKNIPLKFILEKLERDRGIWFKGDSSLLGEQVAVQFEVLIIFNWGLPRLPNGMFTPLNAFPYSTGALCAMLSALGPMSPRLQNIVSMNQSRLPFSCFTG
jgi:hypothetical protein